MFKAEMGSPFSASFPDTYWAQGWASDVVGRCLVLYVSLYEGVGDSQIPLLSSASFPATQSKDGPRMLLGDVWYFTCHCMRGWGIHRSPFSPLLVSLLLSPRMGLGCCWKMSATVHVILGGGDPDRFFLCYGIFPATHPRMSLGDVYYSTCRHKCGWWIQSFFLLFGDI